MRSFCTAQSAENKGAEGDDCIRYTTPGALLVLLLLTRDSDRLAERKERKKTDNPREGWENGTPPPHRDFKERGVVR